MYNEKREKLTQQAWTNSSIAGREMEEKEREGGGNLNPKQMASIGAEY